MAVNKVVYVENGARKTLVDLTADTVTAETLKKGTTAHDKTGTEITGTMESSGGGVTSDSVDITLCYDMNAGHPIDFQLFYTDKQGNLQNLPEDYYPDDTLDLTITCKNPSLIVMLNYEISMSMLLKEHKSGSPVTDRIYNIWPSKDSATASIAGENYKTLVVPLDDTNKDIFDKYKLCVEFIE
ncbi:MAG: hypothetical protein V8S96_10375 [Lachnospiraceae bacterium]